MAAIQLPKPGTKYGPCKAACQHPDCASTRNMAARICRLCQEAIGYATLFYSDPDSPDESALVHADCLQEAYEQEAIRIKEAQEDDDGMNMDLGVL